jgi:ABC-type amino acid transport substrate-binding protein
MKGLKFINGVITSLLMVGILAACGTGESATGENGEGGSEVTEKKLVMATSADYPPYEFIDTEKGNEIIGFDVDIANYITKELGYELEILDMDFNGLIPGMNAGKADFIIAGMSATEERKENVDFSEAYFTSKELLVTKKDSGIKTVEDLEGKTVGVQTGSIQEGKANEIAEQVNINIESRNRIPEIIQEILTGRFDAIIIEDTVAKGYFDNNPELFGFELNEEGEEPGSAIAFPKGSELTEEFNRVLAEMKENGELEKLVVKWFGGEE